MKGYRKLSGSYIELDDVTPVAQTFVEVALRPSHDHVFTDNWMIEPLNPDVCWRMRTTSEQHASRDNNIAAFLDSHSGKAMKALVQVGTDKTIWTYAEIKTKYRQLN